MLEVILAFIIVESVKEYSHERGVRLCLTWRLLNQNNFAVVLLWAVVVVYRLPRTREAVVTLGWSSRTCQACWNRTTLAELKQKLWDFLRSSLALTLLVWWAATHFWIPGQTKASKLANRGKLWEKQQWWSSLRDVHVWHFLYAVLVVSVVNIGNNCSSLTCKEFLPAGQSRSLCCWLKSGNFLVP